MSIEILIADLSHDPFNPTLNFDCAVEYERLKQTSSAVSFYLRAAEYGVDSEPSIVYTSLIKVAQCIESQNDRVHTVSNCLLQAISYLPYRPEAYFFMSQFYERSQQWQESYTFARMGSMQSITGTLPIETGYYGSYCLMFQQAVSAWWIGRKDESIKLMLELESMDIAPEYQAAVQSNLERIRNVVV